MRLTRSLLALALGCSVLVIGGAAEGEASCAPAAHVGGEWRSYGHDLGNTRHQGHEAVITAGNAGTLALAWTFSSAGAGGDGGFQSTPVIADGCVFAGTSSGWVFAINADTGELVWKSELPTGGQVAGLFAVSVPGDGRVYVNSVGEDGPFGAALDRATGGIAWRSEAFPDLGSSINASAVVFDGLDLVGVWGEDPDPNSHNGFAVLDAATGGVLKKTYVIPEADWDDGYGGGGIWATAVVDPLTKYAYAGTANPYSKVKEHENTNAIIKIDLDRSRGTFGEVVDAYKGNVDQYFPGLDRQPVCQTVGPMEQSYALTCAQLDIDFGASATTFTNSRGRKIVGELQKSGVFHAVYADNMQQAWTALVSYPLALGNASSAASDGTAAYVLANPGLLYALNPDSGGIKWVAPVIGGAHYQPPTVAGGVVYVSETKGTVMGFDAATGLPLVVRSISADTGDTVANLGGGVAVARNTVYAAADAGGQGGGWIVAYRPGG